MDSRYLRLSQDASYLLYSENERDGTGHQPRLFSWKSLILLLSVVANAVLSLSLVMMLRENSTPTDFGEHEQAICVIVLTDWPQPRSTLSRPHGTNSGGTRLTVPKTTPIATSCGRPSYLLMVSWLWTVNGLRSDNGRFRCTYRATTAKVSTCWKPTINCTVWYVLTKAALPCCVC